jgi:hypothetical protein
MGSSAFGVPGRLAFIPAQLPVETLLPSAKMPGMGRFGRSRMRLRGLRMLVVIGAIVLLVLLLIGLFG